jgi:hypothetical protein
MMSLEFYKRRQHIVSLAFLAQTHLRHLQDMQVAIVVLAEYQHASKTLNSPGSLDRLIFSGKE